MGPSYYLLRVCALAKCWINTQVVIFMPLHYANLPKKENKWGISQMISLRKWKAPLRSNEIPLLLELDPQRGSSRFSICLVQSHGNIYLPEPSSAFSKKKITNHGETAWGWNGEVDPAAAPSLRPSLTRGMPFSSTLIFVCVAQWNLFWNTRLRSSGP